MHSDDDILLDRKKHTITIGNGKMVLGNFFIPSFYLSLFLFLVGRGWKAEEVDLLKW